MGEPRALIRALGTELSDSPALALARAISSSPAAVDKSATDAAREINPAGIVELVSFIAVLQMLHRLSSFYPDAVGRYLQLVVCLVIG